MGILDDLFGKKEDKPAEQPVEQAAEQVAEQVAPPAPPVEQPAPEPVPAPAPQVQTAPVVEGGDPFVRLVQTRLNQLGYNVGTIDGLEGPMTTEAIKAFQGDKGLDVDGMVGPATQQALEI